VEEDFYIEKIMDPFTIDYIIDYFGRFMTANEATAWKHHTTVTAISSPLKKGSEVYKLYVEKGWLSEDDEVLDLLKKDWLEFRERTATRIIKEHADRIYFNHCPRCGKLARTPVAKQCPFCAYSWHDIVAATFMAESAFAITNRGFYIAGDIVSGRIKIGMKLDLVPLHIPKQVEIIDFGMGRRGDDRTDMVGLNLKGLTEEEQQFLRSGAPFKKICNVESKKINPVNQSKKRWWKFW
jgi:hypothetical protein